MNYKNKIYSKINQDVLEKIQNWKNKGKKIVFTNGCFDILHSGHIQYLAEAKKLGDVFVLGLNSDNSIKRLKGLNRPIKSQDCRADILAFMSDIDIVIIFDEDTPEDLIKKIKPDVLVKGGDWKTDEIVGSDIVLKNGGKVKSLSFLEGYSSTKIIERMVK
jgi:rfaE bifunctional protein nucleotidyltransferase chain/domain